MNINWDVALEYFLRGFSSASGWIAMFLLCVWLLKRFVLSKPDTGKCFVCHKELNSEKEAVCKMTVGSDTIMFCEKCFSTLLQLKEVKQ